MRPNMRPTEKTDLKGALRSLTVYLQKSLGVILLALVLAALSAVLTIIGPDKIGRIATIMSDGLFTGIDLPAIAKLGIFLAVIYGLSALFGFVQHYIMAVVTLKISYRMRGELSEKINRGSLIIHRLGVVTDAVFLQTLCPVGMTCFKPVLIIVKQDRCYQMICRKRKRAA